MNVVTMLGLVSMIFVVGFTWRQAMARDGGTGQSKRAALVEAWSNIVIGFTINFVVNLWLIPMMTHAPLSHSANWWGGWIYTTVSIVRQYVIRRWFNAHLQRLNQFLSR